MKFGSRKGHTIDQGGPCNIGHHEDKFTHVMEEQQLTSPTDSLRFIFANFTQLAQLLTGAGGTLVIPGITLKDDFLH